MKYEKTKNILLSIWDDQRSDTRRDAIKAAIESIKKLEEIERIIQISDFIIQEDVFRYKMICDVIERKE